MSLKNYFQKNGAFGVLLLAGLLMLTSCGSYEYVPYNDGIYGEAANRRNIETKPNTTQKKSNYYSSYFSEKSSQIDNAIQEEAIFTDVDSYSSEGYNAADTTATALNYEGGRPSWGSDYDEITVNVVNNGGWNRPFLGVGFGFNGWGWNDWYGAGWGIYDGWGWNGFYGPGWGGWGNPYAYVYGRNPYVAYNRFNRGRDAYAYNSRSRNGYYNSRYSTRSRNSNYANRSRNSNYSRSRNSNYSRGRQGYTNRRRVSADASNRSRSGSYSNNRSGTYSSRSRSSNNNYSRSSAPRTNTRSYTPRSSSSSRSRSYNPSSGSSRSRSSGYSRSGSSRSSGYSRSGGSRSSSRSSGSRSRGRR